LSHDHRHSGRARSKRALTIALALTGGFVFAELAGGLIAGSLALLADAAHMFSDALSLGVALGAMWLAARPATKKRTFGWQRAEILAALFNGVTLVALAIWIFIEAGQRFADPPDVEGGLVLVVAVLGLAINGTAAWVLSRGEGDSLNVSAALRHVLADILGSLGVIVAAVVILTTGFRLIDPIVSVLIGVLVLASSWSILRDSLQILLESTPEGVDADEIGRAMLGCPVWSRYMICTCGRSRRASRRWRPTCWSAPETTATPGDASSRPCWLGASTSTTPPCRSITKATDNSFSSRLRRA